VAESWDNAETLFSFKARKEMFINVKGRDTAELGHENCFGIWLCDISHQLNVNKI
jgi:hypothetical protein